MTVTSVEAADLTMDVDNADPTQPVVGSRLITQVADQALNKLAADAAGIPFGDMALWLDVDRDRIARQPPGADPYLVDFSGSGHTADSSGEGTFTANQVIGRYYIPFDSLVPSPRYVASGGFLQYLHSGQYAIYCAFGRSLDGNVLFGTTDGLDAGIAFSRYDDDHMQWAVRNDTDLVALTASIPAAFDGGQMQVVSLISQPQAASTGDRIKAWVNGAGPTADNAIEEPAALHTGGQLYIGGGAGGANWKGSLGELLIYSALHDDAQREAVEAYLMGKWVLGE